MGFKGKAVVVKVALMVLACLLTRPIAIAGKGKYSHCNTTCGDLHFQYPFGITGDCSLNEYFRITCNESSRYATINISNSTTGDIKIQYINLQGELRITAPVLKTCFNDSFNSSTSTHGVKLENSTLFSPFSVSSSKNKFTVVGCDTTVSVSESLTGGERFSTGCNLVCTNFTDVRNGSCSGIGCCQSSFPKDVKGFNITMSSFHTYSTVSTFNPCSYAFVVEDGQYDFSTQDLKDLRNKTEFPMILSWAVERKSCAEAKKNMTTYACKNSNSECVPSENGVGYICQCKQGYEGNPYLDDDDGDGCRKVSGGIKALPLANNRVEKALSNGIGPIVSLGALVGLAVLSHSFSWMPTQKTAQQLFLDNGGDQLLQLQGGDSQTPTLFTQDDVEMLTKCLDATRVIGRGVLGTVYRGTLPDNREFAVKKTRKRGGPRKASIFAREVFELSKINNETVAQLLGICLETEVPMLIYEFVKSSHNLYSVINAGNNENAKQNQQSFLSWEERKKIAADTAEAVLSLHSAPVPIVHGNIKSCNILLGEDGRAKLTDCGALRLIPLEDLVRASAGYVDPEYIHTGQLNEKSDVYSFGVVLIELLTGKKAFEFGRDQQESTLVLHFVSAVNKNHLMLVIDERIMDGTNENEKELKDVASLAWNCVKLIGEERPHMQDVAKQLKPLVKIDKIENINPSAGDDENEGSITEASTSVLGNIPNITGGNEEDGNLE